MRISKMTPTGRDVKGSLETTDLTASHIASRLGVDADGNMTFFVGLYVVTLTKEEIYLLYNKTY